MFACFYEARRENEFSIGWSNSNQLNEFQLRKSKNKEVTGKITTQAIIQGQDLSYPLRQINAYDPPSRDQRDCTSLSIQMPRPPTKTFPRRNWKSLCRDTMSTAGRHPARRRD
jgi:hypothetical protein